MTNDLVVADFLSHHGVKGQRWGVRNKKAGSELIQVHSDKILNALYNKMGKLYEENKLDEAMLLLDKVLKRRVKIKEITAKEAFG